MSGIFFVRPLFLAAAVAAASSTAFADPSAPDTGFGDEGVVIENFGGVETGGKLFQLSSGQILLAGNGSGITAGHSFTRYNLNGTIDTTYGTGGTATGHDGSLWGLTLLPGDILMAAGDAYSGNLTDLNDAAVMRYTAAGAKDGAFGTLGRVVFPLDPGAPADEHATDVIVLASGKLLVCGYLWRGGTDFDMVVLRLTSAGILDTTFADGGYYTFDFNGGVDKAWKVLELPDESIIVYGEVGDKSVFGAPTKVFFLRLTSEGEVDTTFGGSGTGYATVITDVNSDTPGGMVRLANGKFVFAIGGTAMWTVGRLNENGTRDTEFGANGIASLAAVYEGIAYPLAQSVAVVVQSDGRVVVGGTLSGFTAQFQIKNDLGIARFEADGTPDTTFNSGSAQRRYNVTDLAPEAAASLLLQDDGKIVLAGFYPNGTDDRFMLRIEGDEPAAGLCGDANGDGKVNASDALATLRAAVGVTTCAPSICDVTGDGQVRAADALRVLQFAVGSVGALECGA
ncbi:MAG: dockerin type I domain-containing protein [Candidatus Binatia bacterium]